MTTNLEPNELWFILDSSKLTTAMDCQRKYFFEYILGWRPDTPNHHLIFGQALHSALAYMYENIEQVETQPKDLVMAAYEEFLLVWREHFDEHSDSLYEPKTPGAAAEALLAYLPILEQDNREYSVEYVEISGYSPMSLGKNAAKLFFKMDTVLKHRETGIYRSLEHKTTSRVGRQWTDQFILSTQVGAYAHTLFCLYPAEMVYGVTINGFVFQKTKLDFVRVPCPQTVSQMEVWYNNTWKWLNEINMHTSLLIDHLEQYTSRPTLDLFRMNTQSCTKYFGCPYHDLCVSWANPLQNLDRMPFGFRVEYWDPRERTSPNKQISLRYTNNEGQTIVSEVDND